MPDPQRRKTDKSKIWNFIYRFESVVNTFLIVGLIVGAGIYWWHVQQLDSTQAAERLQRSVDRIERVSDDLGNVKATAHDALNLAKTNEAALSELRGRILRNEDRRSRRDQEMISRLERIEALLLESRN